MRPEFDGEIDSLLRGAARRGGAWPVARGGDLPHSISNGAAADSHLDADEIAAFGEGALPAAARARYSSHLADCDDCRRSVAQVALAAGSADRIEERERKFATAPAAAQSPSWRERLAAIFAPRAWRYAMPVVALVAVSAVVLVVMRRVPREEAAVTREEGGRAGASRPAPVSPAAPEPSRADAASSQQTPSRQSAGQVDAEAVGGVAPTAGAGAESRAAGVAAKQGAGTVDRVGQPVAGGSTAAAGAQTDLAQRGVTQLSPPGAPTFAAEPAATPTPAPPPPAVAPPQMVSRNAATPAPPPERANLEAGAAMRDDSRNSAPRDGAPATKRHRPQRGVTGGEGEAAELASAAESKSERESRRARRPAPGAAASRGESARPQSAPEGDREQQQQGETRSAGGRRFRREGGVWIDTAYKPSQATTVVRRDSEQYRALVADEPGIGRISRALGGEAVIVWKGRAYRVKP